ncbi:hypothetical protein N7931_01750 [Catenovulum sp. 2E275]|uniref:hypothetical protein n=1 Tax=Catenovulum sp. 2E275 TaxID=2980497 RepID=UPI0021D20214|nr:hypothetical protein [Catenovulum sp. 2E275]MCU4674343.1 hypothetical protein [Catenovulum sp. 2E275]
MQLINSKIIWQNNQHNAFTDMVEYQGLYLCCFRQATNHVSKDGFIRILSSTDLINWQTVSLIRKSNCDLRDPKLIVHPNGQLLLLYYCKVFDNQGRNTANVNCIHFTSNPVSWSGAKVLGNNNWWLWRIRFYQKQALGIAYNRSQNKVNLYQGDPLRSFHLTIDGLFGLKTHGKAYPNESDISFLADGTAICILRRDADSYTAQLGIAKPNYKKWQWFDLGEYLGGPALYKLKNGRIIIAARRILMPFRLATWLFELDLTNKKIIPLIELPSSGDNSYPAMLEKDNHLFVSYYSQHRQNAQGQINHPSQPCAIYLAKLSL